MKGRQRVGTQDAQGRACRHARRGRRRPCRTHTSMGRVCPGHARRQQPLPHPPPHTHTTGTARGATSAPIAPTPHRPAVQQYSTVQYSSTAALRQAPVQQVDDELLAVSRQHRLLVVLAHQGHVQQQRQVRPQVLLVLVGHLGQQAQRQLRPVRVWVRVGGRSVGEGGGRRGAGSSMKRPCVCARAYVRVCVRMRVWV